MRFFWRACGVCAFYGFVNVAWSYNPTFIAFPHGLPIMRYPYCFFGMYGIWSCVFPVAFVLMSLTVPAQVLVVALHSVAKVAAFSPIPRYLALVLGCFWSCLGISRLRLNSLAALGVLPFSSVCLSYASTVACGCWPWGFFAAALLTGCPCMCVSVLSGAAELCLFSLLLLGAG